jgi:hypothetical protein
MRLRLAWMVATACVLAACATGGDSSPDDGLGDGDSGGTVEASSGHDAGGSAGHDSAATQDTGSPTPEAGGGGDDASEPDDAPSIDEAATAKDSATTQDTGTTVPETGTGPDTGTTGGGICSGAAKYDLEAAAAVASGTFTLCLGGVCGAGQCCFEELNPGNICVAE